MAQTEGTLISVPIPDIESLDDEDMPEFAPHHDGQ